jgi:branched-subunit amino acid aminotransferase/4-amino-4-deoxychorismate lyase
MKSWCWNQTRFEEGATLPLTDRGFRYGMSLFESMRVSNGSVEFWAGHRQRIHAACLERDFAVAETVLDEAAVVLATAGMDGFARIYVTAGDGSPTTPVQAPRVFVLLEHREPEREESWDICFSDDFFHPLFPGLKTANYWFHCDALARARQGKFDEALLFNDHAELVSACCANVFLVRDGRILTPPRGSGCRQGVVREWVIKRRKVEERRLRREDVVNADEIFLTNSWLGVMPVSTLEGRPLGPRVVSSKLAGEMAARRAGE